jgi:hypothetical protein
MPYHERDRRLSLLGKRQELFRKFARNLAVERDVVSDPETVKDREQQQWVFRWLSERFSLLYQQTRLLYSRPGFRSSKPTDMDERGYEG